MSANPNPTRKSSRTLRELHAALLQEIAHHPEHVPCLQQPGGIDWLDPHHKTQQAAAELCTGCQAFQACNRYAAATRKAPGVWAGTTEQDREQRATEYRATRKSNQTGKATRDDAPTPAEHQAERKTNGAATA